MTCCLHKPIPTPLTPTTARNRITIHRERDKESEMEKMNRKEKKLTDRVDELRELSSDLISYFGLLAQGLERTLVKTEIAQAGTLFNSIGHKSGYLARLITDLTNEEKVDVHGTQYNMWTVALRIPIDSLAKNAVGFCLQVVNRAIGQLEDDIRMGKRDVQTGELLTKSGISASKPSEALSAKANWKDIKTEYDVTKRSFGKRINFVKDPFKRTVIYRDVEQAFVLASAGFLKPAVILAGGVIEELLRQYLKHKNITPINDSFDGYIQTCEQNGLLKAGISRLTDSARHFRNLVHLSKEETKRHTISKSAAMGAVSSIFTIANDF